MAQAAPVISLFSGAGGLDLGVADAGAQIRVCVEPDPDCVKTLKANTSHFPDLEVIDRAIEEPEATTEAILDRGGLRRSEAALLVGGPPCQPFSKAGYWLKERRQGAGDPRAKLMDEYVRVLREAEPAGFILENVASITHPNHVAAFDKLRADAEALGYSVTWDVLHAVEYGVPQTRSRVFLVGLRGGAAPTLPRRTRLWLPHGRRARRRPRPPETAGRWIAHLDTPERREPQEEVSGRWAEALREIPPGKNYNHLTEWAGHPDPSFKARSKYWSFLLKLSPYRPSWTIQATPGPWTGPFHWSDRRLRVPELAALQTFPPTYRLQGGRRSQMRQVGNAVPCLLASKVAACLLKDILGTRPARGRVLRYGLADGYPFDEASAPHRGTRW